MNLNGNRRNDATTGPIKLTIVGKMADRLRAVHATAIEGEGPYGCHLTSLDTMILQILDNFLVDQRSNKLRDDPSRHWARHGDDVLTYTEAP